MKWKCEADDRYIKFTLDEGQTADMRGREEEFGPHYAVLAELYRKKARLAVVEKDGLGTLVEAEMGRVVAQDVPGKWAELRPHVGHELYIGDFCGEDLIYVECVPCRTLIYDRPWYE